MKIQKKWLYILLAAAGVFGVVTILFFSGEKWLRDGWYYIPDRAIAIALGLCVFWLPPARVFRIFQTIVLIQR